MKQTIEIEVPEGYEFHKVQEHYGAGIQALVTFKKKPTKDFNWFVDQYLQVSGVSTCDQISNWFEPDQLTHIGNNLKQNKFSLVPWEIKIGLCCFICNEIGIPWFEYIHQINETVYFDEIKMANNILPDGFRDDIINKPKNN